LWNATSGTFQLSTSTQTFLQDAAASADGTVFSSGGGGEGISGPPILLDASLHLTAEATSDELQFNSQQNMPGQALSAAGSLIFQPTAVGVDIVDVNQGILRERLVLPEMPAQAFTADQKRILAIDETGQRLFLITQSGITIVQLDAVPLSVGHLSPNQISAGGGASVTIRGSGFAPNATIAMGSAHPVATVVDSNTITLTAPSLPAGAIRVTVTNPDGHSYSLDAAITAQ
jgi:IPT/TIG domain